MIPFFALAKYFLSQFCQTGELIFIIDGSQIGVSHTALIVSVLWKSKPIPLLWVVKKGLKGYFSEQMHVDVLRVLTESCPQRCRVILLGDWEFDGLNVRNVCQ